MQHATIQRDAFKSYEANEWFNRNKSAIEQYDGDKDHIIKLIRQYDIRPDRILEIGSSAGYRINFCKLLFPEAQVVGIDPSANAIKAGMELFNNIELHVGTADDLSRFEDGYFDLVIMGFVFYVVDRSLLLRVISEIDRILADKGFFINVDFYAAKTIRNGYQHIKESNAFSFKQRYEDIFVATQMYQPVHSISFNHATNDMDGGDDYSNKCSVFMLKKDLHAAYI